MSVHYFDVSILPPFIYLNRLEPFRVVDPRGQIYWNCAPAEVVNKSSLPGYGLFSGSSRKINTYLYSSPLYHS